MNEKRVAPEAASMQHSQNGHLAPGHDSMEENVVLAAGEGVLIVGDEAEFARSVVGPVFHCSVVSRSAAS